MDVEYDTGVSVPRYTRVTIVTVSDILPMLEVTEKTFN